MARSINDYCESSFNIMTCTPRILVPYIFSMALPNIIGSVVIITLILMSMPFIGDIAAFLEENQDLLFYEDAYGWEESMWDDKDLEGLQIIGLLFLLVLPIIFIIALSLYSYISGGTIGYVSQSLAYGRAGMKFKNFLFYGRRCLLRLFILNLLKVIFSCVLLALIIFALTVNPFLAVLFLIIAIPVLLFVFFFLFFTDECIVIEGTGVADSIKRSADIVSNNISEVIAFILILIVAWAVYFIIFVIAQLTAVILNSDISPMFYFFEALILTPWIHIAKINFFLDRINRGVLGTVRNETLERAGDRSLEIAVCEITREETWKRARERIRETLMEKREERFDVIGTTKALLFNSPGILKNFLASNLPYVFAVLVFCMVGFAAGYYIGGEFSFLSDDLAYLLISESEDGFFGYTSMPFIDTLMYFFHNSSVSVGIAFGGLFFGIPAALGTIVNTCMVGFFYGLLPPHIMTAIILPHGPFELFALFISAVAGLKLGVKFMTGAEDIDDVFEETLRIMFVVVALLAIAAFLEAFVAPLLVHAII